MDNKLSEELIRLELERKDREVYVYNCLESTNDTAKKLAFQGKADGTAVIADMQTNGRGRLGRSFVSPLGTGIYMSVVVRPNFELEFAPMITAAAACAAAEAVENLCGTAVGIKWVNDLYLNGRKICGILTESSLSPQMKKLDFAVIGIGINVLSVRNVFDSELVRIAGSVEDETGVKVSRNSLCAGILNKLDCFMQKIENRSFLDDYRKREILTGNVITANNGDVQISGKAIGIDENANLIIKFPNGEIMHLGSGEANLCRIK